MVGSTSQHPVPCHGALSLLVVDGKRLEWPRTVDEKLQAVVTGAIQLVILRERAVAAGISPDAMAGVLAPAQVANVELGSVAGRSPGDESATLVMVAICSSRSVSTAGWC
jgi:ABC-2 type transport system permease protein